MSDPLDLVVAQIRDVRDDLVPLLEEARAARLARSEAPGADSTAVCAWNHFENIPTFFNWNNRPR
ncbi:multiple cyclophane-containing RiPP AmcA [Catellatospora tritici]|uniref:multiple cyclophane-containing RiPP AmcA n=1 Tax=Catellatospora tritici TaxID=2851566 RepID=UPI0020C2C6FE|nr:multiple cyclophane-containing RiPP AmcA [Catellatospora tritici]